MTDVEFEQLWVSVLTLRFMVGRLFALDARKSGDFEDYMRDVTEIFEDKIVRNSKKVSASPMDLEEALRIEMQWYVTAARTV